MFSEIVFAPWTSTLGCLWFLPFSYYFGSCFLLALGIVGSYLLEKQEHAILRAMKGAADNKAGGDTDETSSTQISIARTLAVSVGLFVVFAVLGIVYFVVSVPDMSFVDATYLSVVSLTTVGE